GDLDLERSTRGGDAPLPDLVANGSHDVDVVVAEDHRTEAHHDVHELIAIRVVDVRTVRAFDVDGGWKPAAGAANRGVDASREDRLCAFEEGGRTARRLLPGCPWFAYLDRHRPLRSPFHV